MVDKIHYEPAKIIFVFSSLYFNVIQAIKLEIVQSIIIQPIGKTIFVFYKLK